MEMKPSPYLKTILKWSRLAQCSSLEEDVIH